MRKTICLFCCLLLLACVVTGCGQKPDTPAVTEVVTVEPTAEKTAIPTAMPTAEPSTIPVISSSDLEGYAFLNGVYTRINNSGMVLMIVGDALMDKGLNRAYTLCAPYLAEGKACHIWLTDMYDTDTNTIDFGLDTYQTVYDYSVNKPVASVEEFAKASTIKSMTEQMPLCDILNAEQDIDLPLPSAVPTTEEQNGTI